MAVNAAPQSGYYKQYHHQHHDIKPIYEHQVEYEPVQHKEVEHKKVEQKKVAHKEVEHKKEEQHHEEEHYDHHPQYKFQYKVEDKKHHDFHGHQEHRDKDQTVGEYWLVEPDGHKRIVKYHVDKKSGFVAQVHRELVKHH